MKTIAAVIIAAATFNAFAEDPSSRCIAGLAGDARLVAIADKVGLDTPREPNSPTLQRYASAEERAALAVWQGLRRQCFDAAEPQRRKTLDAQSRSSIQSAFIFQQLLLSRVQQGELTYGEFNQRRAEVAESFDASI